MISHGRGFEEMAKLDLLLYMIRVFFDPVVLNEQLNKQPHAQHPETDLVRAKARSQLLCQKKVVH